jgi:hypothetical protein
MPGGFHPFHAGHASLYQSALKAFPGADVYVAATNDTKTRPFPFAIKEKLAKVAGVAPGHFIQVKSPFQPREITDKFNPEQDVVIFVRSEKDRNESPKPGGTKKDGSPAYFQPYTGKDVQPFGKHAYMAYLPTVEFGPGISSATEIRNAWPKLNDKRKTAMVMSLYPATQKNPKLATNVVKMLDMGMGTELAEGPIVKRIVHPNKVNIYVRHDSKKPALLIATDIPYTIYDKFIMKAMQKYPQFKQTDFSFKSSDKVNEFVIPSGGDNREPDEELLRKLAAQWWHGTEQQMAKAQRTLELMGWEIGQDESGDDDAGVFVIRVGDENGDSYIAFPHSELQLDEVRLSESADYLEEK